MPVPDLTLTVLGASPAWPNPGGACSGYLVRHGETAVLVDCGSGVTSRLRQRIDPANLTGVVISHLHPDHHVDLITLYYALRFGAPPGTRVPLRVPPGGRRHLDRIGRLFDGLPNWLDGVFDVAEYQPDRPLALGSLTFEFRRVQHYIPSYAMRIRSPEGRLLVFSSDVAPCPAIVEAARGANLFLCEAAWLSPSDDRPEPERRGHLAASEAAEIAREAGAERLLLTHYRADDDAMREHHRRTADAVLHGRVALAVEGDTYSV